MLCMICKHDVPDTAQACPTCGADPWKLPEMFLNPEQHQIWLNDFYYPQLARWEEQQRAARRAQTPQTTAAQPAPGHIRTTEQRHTSGSSGQSRNVHTAPKRPMEIRFGTLVVPDHVTEIGESAFRNNLHLKKIVLHPGVRKIGNFAFAGCGNLREVDFSEGIEEIGHLAFWGCNRLLGILLPESMKYIGYGAFYRDAYWQDDLGKMSVEELCSPIYRTGLVSGGRTVVILSRCVYCCEASIGCERLTCYTVKGLGELHFGQLQRKFNEPPKEFPMKWQHSPILTDELVVPPDLTEIPDEAYMLVNSHRVFLHGRVQTIGHRSFALSQSDALTMYNTVQQFYADSFVGTYVHPTPPLIEVVDGISPSDPASRILHTNFYRHLRMIDKKAAKAYARQHHISVLF